MNKQQQHQRHHHPSVGTSIAKTALDALHAKVSLVHCGYNPVRTEHNGGLYRFLLDAIRLGVSTTATTTTNNEEGSTRENNNVSTFFKRQSPLVNAGYALRVASLSKMIHEFIVMNNSSSGTRTKKDNNDNDEHVHAKPSNPTTIATKDVNIIILGCGFDVLGLWACGGYDNVNVYEVDCIENCIVKAKSLIETELIDPTTTSATTTTTTTLATLANEPNEKNKPTTNRVILKGTIGTKFKEQSTTTNTNLKAKNNNNNNNNNGYTLLSANLQHISSLQEALLQSSFDETLPTMVVSELVMAYLGSDAVSDLLSFLANKVCRPNDQSIFIAYEPTLPSSNNNSGSSSIIQGYAKEYFSQFESKLNKGNNDKEKNASSLFEPIGPSAYDAIQMLRSCGFNGPVDCKEIATACKGLALSHVNLSPELFDEHAAFRLHMHCYSVIGAKVSCMSSRNHHKSSTSSSSSSVRHYLNVCPWSKLDDATKGFGQSFHTNQDNLTLSAIKKEHQEQVRILFSNTYQHLFDNYPSVKKMIKTSMKVDLKSKVIDSKTNSCAIWEYYSQRGGSFWVVLDGAHDDKVIGCIGVTRMAQNSHMDSSSDRSYELHRLAVHLDYRGRGVGKLLLETAAEFIHCKELSEKISVFATTPEILESANLFYSSHSFQNIDEVILGTMKLIVYKKVI